MSQKIYLAGPILGCTYDGCARWRLEAAARLRESGIEALDPMRGKKFLAAHEVMGDGYAEHALATSEAITARDRFDAGRGDAVLLNLLGAERVPTGSMVEVGWADAWRKPVVLVAEKGGAHDHRMARPVHLPHPHLGRRHRQRPRPLWRRWLTRR